MADNNKTTVDRDVLKAAHEKGAFATFLAFFRLSGPGWLQAAITLGGGSLGSALYLGVLGGYSMLWLQLVAIVAGVIMLSAISYITLSTGRRPYQAINEHINPVLGVGWLVATILANMIWVMPQFSLCFDAIDNNLAQDAVSDTPTMKWGISAGLFVLAAIMIFLSASRGLLSRLFDLFLKIVIGIIVVCFVAVVVILFRKGLISGEVLYGFIPDISQWWNPSTSISDLIAQLPEGQREEWTKDIIKTQREVMISTAATAVGINMTFLLPYSLLARGWDKPFRGLARFDLITGMAIPFILVTSCIVIASAYSFHGKVDEKLLQKVPANATTEEKAEILDSIRSSVFYKAVSAQVAAKFQKEDDATISADLEQIKTLEAELKTLIEDVGEEGTGVDEKQNEISDAKVVLFTKASEVQIKLASIKVKPNSNQLATTLEPFLGDKANLVFGAGALAMGFSTIIILMMINGYAVREMFGRPESQGLNLFGALLAGVAGMCYPIIWGGASKTWLIIMASTFGAMLLPIAYVTFFIMMNNRTLMGEHKPTGARIWIWNILMMFGVAIALAAAISSISLKIDSPQGMFVIGAAATFVILAIFGFSARTRGSGASG